MDSGIIAYDMTCLTCRWFANHTDHASKPLERYKTMQLANYIAANLSSLKWKETLNTQLKEEVDAKDIWNYWMPRAKDLLQSICICHISHMK